MAHADFLGNAVTASDDATARGIDDFVGGFLSYESVAANVLAAADADAGSTLANAYAAMLWLFLEAPGAAARAAPYLARAEAALRPATKRERSVLAFTRAWAGEDMGQALAIGEAINAEFPRDLVILKLRQYFLFNVGDAAGMLRAAEGVFDANRDVAQMHGMIAFAYEQCHLLEEAEHAARQALELKRKEPWAHHALAHVMLTQGRIDEGAAFMEAASAEWSGLNSFMSTHNWWHLALFYISQGRFEDALALYDGRVWGVDKSYTQDQVGAVSLLARLELAGVDVGDRWNDVADHLATRAADTVLPFLTLQYLYGLARAERPEADTLLNAVRSHAEHADAVWRAIALPAAEALVAHARGQYAETVDKLGAALPRLAAIGGSHAQRDLFEQIWLDALIRNGQLGAAQQVLELRRRYDRDSVPLNRALAETYAKLGLKPESEIAAQRARNRRSHR
ncbi:MAG: tetratricopeptide repeat protein [Pseudomonadota bacterium]